MLRPFGFSKSRNELHSILRIMQSRTLISLITVEVGINVEGVQKLQKLINLERKKDRLAHGKVMSVVEF